MDKEQEAKDLLDPLYEKMDKGEGLDEYERGVMDTVNWLFEDSDKPDID